MVEDVVSSFIGTVFRPVNEVTTHPKVFIANRWDDATVVLLIFCEFLKGFVDLVYASLFIEWETTVISDLMEENLAVREQLSGLK